MNPTRRSLLFRGSVLLAGTILPVPFFKNLHGRPTLIETAEAQDLLDTMDEKSALRVLSDRPFNAETPVHLLDEPVTSAGNMFVRNNGSMPSREELSPDQWELLIDGEVERPQKFSISDLKNSFENISLQLQIECGGNGRRFYHPGANGNQWSFGAISCAEWTGVRLADVLAAAGIKSSAVYTAHYGVDRHLSGDPTKVPISRGVPMAKALDPHNLIAWEMNGDSIPYSNGYPLRLIVPGWPGSCSQKWLNRISLRDVVHDGPKMEGQSYRVPEFPVAPGTSVPDSAMKIIESMPVKSIITNPETGHRQAPGKPFEIRGHAWAGDNSVEKMDISIDFGSTWAPADLLPAKNKFAWQHWRAEISLPQAGYYEVWARATDSNGAAQPPVPPNWNPRGYLNNMQHRIAVIAV
nr:sulfite oxidase [Hyphomonas sp. Mor2]